MTNRVLLNESGFKVSKPGVNVLTAGVAGLIFSSDFGSYAFYDEGSLSYSWSVSGTGGSYSNNVSLGKTFATPPAVLFQLSLGSGTYMPIGDSSGFSMTKENVDPDAESYMSIWATVTTTQIQFRGWFQRQTGLPTGVTIRYSIYEYNL